MMKLYGNLNNNPKVLIIGVFHGDEPQGYYLIKEYLEQKNNTNLLMIPCLNEYGFKNSTRVNSNGVDLNRNFPTKNWEQTPKNEYYGGEFPSSEIETNFVIETVKKYNPEVILTLHTPYKVVNYDGPANELAQDISKITGYPAAESIGYPTPGSFGTWAGVERKIKVITLEMEENPDDLNDISHLKKPVFEIFEYLENY